MRYAGYGGFDMQFQKIGFIGLGLIGGSIAKRLKAFITM